jgi:hypothetical protein
VIGRLATTGPDALDDQQRSARRDLDRAAAATGLPRGRSKRARPPAHRAGGLEQHPCEVDDRQHRPGSCRRLARLEQHLRAYARLRAERTAAVPAPAPRRYAWDLAPFRGTVATDGGRDQPQRRGARHAAHRRPGADVVGIEPQARSLIGITTSQSSAAAAHRQ